MLFFLFGKRVRITSCSLTLPPNGSIDFQRQKLITLHQSQIQAYHVAAKQALMEWATNVTLPEINNTIHDTVTSYIKSCRAVTIATRPIWRELSTSSTSTKKELPVNEMAMNIVEERAKAVFEKLQQQRKASNHITTATTMENIPEEDGEDEDGEIDEGEDTEDAVVAEITEEDNKNDVNNDAADNEDSVMNEDATNTQQDSTTTNAEVKANPATSKSPVPPKKNMISLVRKNKQNQTQMPLPPPSKRSTTTTNTKPTTIKKTNVTKPINTAVQQHRNNQAMNSRGSGRGSGNNNSSGRSVGGRGGGGAPRSGGSGK